jgi:general stress protein YciG
VSQRKSLELGREFVAPDFEVVEGVGAEGGDHGNVGGVAATSDQDAADAGRVVTMSIGG